LKAGAKVDGGVFSDSDEKPVLITPLLVAARAGHAAVIAVLF
jgi:hypothetical protein